MQRVALGPQGCKEQKDSQALKAKKAGPSRGGLGGTLTVHVISMLFFLVPSPLTSAGLDSGAGTQGDAKFKPDVCYGHSEQLLSLLADQPLLWLSSLSISLHTIP